jgi:hypothetical protein
MLKFTDVCGLTFVTQFTDDRADIYANFVTKKAIAPVQPPPPKHV